MSFDPLLHPSEAGPALLGWTIACRGTAAVLTEVEAYHQEEPAAHSWGGRATPRTQGLFGPPGTAYVYVSYGMHLCANLVTGPLGSGEALLLRAAAPLTGETLMRTRRAAPRGADPLGYRPAEVLGGPGRLAQALDIKLADTGSVMLRADVSTLDEALAAAADGPMIAYLPAEAASVGIELPLSAEDLLVGPRVGITRAVELPWRFGVRGALVSKPFRV